jgi:UDP-N-acetylmuramoyl-tripeptide--D-alanyl-D-alanine ligase
MKFNIDEMAKVCGGKVISGDRSLECNGISIDTRKILRGELYVAIKGAHFDGHDFIADAVERGAVAIVAATGDFSKDGVAVIRVSDTERALGDIAAWWRSRFDIPRIAITGSNGKSTTKEMVSAVVSVLGGVLKTEGNFNNTIGLPLTIFRMNETHDVAVLEMGMNAKGEIKRLTEIANPTVGLITNVTAAHLEKLQTVEAVAMAKGELFEAMGADATAVINAEDPWIMRAAKKFSGRKITFGMQNDCDVRFLNMETDNLDNTRLAFSVRGREHNAMIPLPGAHNVMNSLAAIAVGEAMGIDAGESVARIEKFKPMAMRFERIQLANGVRVVNDSYNANPASMKAAFRTVGSAKRAGRFIAAIGDMLELGESSDALHEIIGADAARMGVHRLFILGNFSASVAKGAEKNGMKPSDITRADDIEEIADKLEAYMRAGDVLLVKGSRGMRMERLVEFLKNKIGMG